MLPRKNRGSRPERIGMSVGFPATAGLPAGAEPSHRCRRAKLEPTEWLSYDVAEGVVGDFGLSKKKKSPEKSSANVRGAPVFPRHSEYAVRRAVGIPLAPRASVHLL